MSHSAFLRAIIDAPDDDLPRLVFADYLDETGDHARAEFIRVQCELARLPEHDPKFRELEDREHELLGGNEKEWLPDTTRLREWDWQRGFLSGIADNWMPGEVAETLFAEHPITHWTPARYSELGESLDGKMLPDQLKARIQHVDFANWFWPSDLISFTYFFLLHEGLLSYEHSGSVRLEEFTRLAGRGISSHLTKLNLGGRFANEPSEILQPFGARFAKCLESVRIRSLSLDASGLSTKDLGFILTGQCSASFRELDIASNLIGPDAYRAFERANPELRLHSLDVSGTPLASISLEPLLNARSLEDLHKFEMNGCGSARRNMEVLAKSKFWTQATHFRAHSGTIPADTLRPLCESNGPIELRLLDLADNYLRTEGVRMLCEAPWVESLTWLALSGNYLEDEACQILARSGRLRNLRTLHLANNNFRQEGSDGEQLTDAAARWLAQSESLTNLRILSLSHTGITHRGMIAALENPHWHLSGLGVAGCDLDFPAAHLLANSPRLARLNWLDLSGNRRLGGYVLRPLAESPHLSPLLELDCGGIDVAPELQAIFRERLGVRFSS